MLLANYSLCKQEHILQPFLCCTRMMLATLGRRNPREKTDLKENGVEKLCIILSERSEPLISSSSRTFGHRPLGHRSLAEGANNIRETFEAQGGGGLSWIRNLRTSALRALNFRLSSVGKQMIVERVVAGSRCWGSEVCSSTDVAQYASNPAGSCLVSRCCFRNVFPPAADCTVVNCFGRQIQRDYYQVEQQ